MVGSRPRVRTARLTIVILVIVVCLALCLLGSIAYFGLVPNNNNSSPNKQDVLVAEKSAKHQPSLSATEIGLSPLDPVLDEARRMSQRFKDEVADYSAILTKRERIQGTLGDEQTMQIKIRCRKDSPNGTSIPMHVYVRFEEPKSAIGREVIWVEGRDNNKMVAHEGGWFNLARVSLDPEGTLAMMGNKYPITQIGLGKLLEKLIEKGERYRSDSDCEVRISDEESLDEIPCRLFEITFPAKRDGLEFYKARIYIDRAREIPIRYEAFLWPAKPGDEPPLEEQYTYRDVRLNPMLSDRDFDPDNPDYEFP